MADPINSLRAVGRDDVDYEAEIAARDEEILRLRDLLDECAAMDPRVRVEHRAENGGIVAASNTALAMAEGERSSTRQSSQAP